MHTRHRKEVDYSGKNKVAFHSGRRTVRSSEKQSCCHGFELIIHAAHQTGKQNFTHYETTAFEALFSGQHFSRMSLKQICFAVGRREFISDLLSVKIKSACPRNGKHPFNLETLSVK